jgi:predicted transcriptional regulator
MNIESSNIKFDENPSVGSRDVYPNGGQTGMTKPKVAFAILQTRLKTGLRKSSTVICHYNHSHTSHNLISDYKNNIQARLKLTTASLKQY